MPRTQHERLWIAAAAAVALLMAAVGYFLLIGPQRSRTAAVRAEVASASFQESSLQSRIVGLTAQNRRIAAYRAELARAQRALPAAGDLTAAPQLLRGLAACAAATSTSITDLTVGDPTPLTPTTAAGPGSGSTAASASASSAPTASAQAGTTPLSSITVGATVSGTPTTLNRFLARLQTLQARALLVTAVTLSAASDAGAGGAGSATTLKLTMSAFLRTAASSATPAAGAATPTPGG